MCWWGMRNYLIENEVKMLKGYVCHTGGAHGADMSWELVGMEYGVIPKAYSFVGHNTISQNTVVLTDEELDEGYEMVQEIQPINKKFISSPYVRRLLSRNWFQVKNSETVYAIAEFDEKNPSLVAGGTGWAVEMAKIRKMPIFVFSQQNECWFEYDYKQLTFVSIGDAVPIIVKNFAGIGTRDLTDVGMQAIITAYEKTDSIVGAMNDFVMKLISTGSKLPPEDAEVLYNSDLWSK